MGEKIKVHVVCGCYVGEAKWQYSLDDWYKEPDECSWQATIEVSKEEWAEGYVSIHCPACHAKLDQCMDHFQLIHHT